MQIVFDWHIIEESGDTPEAMQAMDEKIAQVFVDGNQGEFIQTCCDGNLNQFAKATPDVKRSFARLILTRNNHASIDAAELDKELTRRRQEIADTQQKRKLPDVLKVK